MARRLPEDQRKALERRAWELRSRSWSLQRIADELGVNVSTVHKMLARIERRLAERFAKRAERYKARQTAQLEHIAEEAMAAWERSQLNAEAEKTVDEEIMGEDGGRTGVMRIRTERTSKGQVGDAAMLNQARAALADIRTIWGIDAPAKQDITSNGASLAPRVVKVMQPPMSDDEPTP